MKKLLLILFVFITLLLIALIISPILFEDDIKARVKGIINEQVKAKVDFNDIELSFITNFPKASIKIGGLNIINNDPFNNIKLIYKDGDNAHWDENPLDIIIEKIEVSKGSNLSVKLAEGGGFAISIKKV